MSFLSEIISSAGEAEILEVNDLILNTSKTIATLKLEVKDAMENSYIKLLPLKNDNASLIMFASELSENVKQLQVRLENQTKRDVANLTNELKTLKDTLQESTFSVDLVIKLLSIENNIVKSRNEQLNLNYDAAAKYLFAAQEGLDKIGAELEFLDIFVGLTEELITRQDSFLREAFKKWQTCHEWEVLEVERKNKAVSLRVSVNTNKNSSLIKALYLYNAANKEIKSFGETLMTDVLTPIISMESSVQKVNKVDFSILKIEIDLKSKQPSYSNVLSNLTTVFNFLFEYFDLQITENTTFINTLGEFIGTKFISLLIEGSLSDTIPYKREDLANYGGILEDIQNFEKLLKMKGFLTEDNTLLEKYYGNVDELFANKTQERYLEAARTLMKYDLHDMIKVGPVCVEEEESIDKTLGLTELSPNIFQFPVCHISKSTNELLKLVRNILEEVTKSDDKFAVSLFFTTRNVFTMYMDIVPVCHKKLLDNIPQQSALLHNNLMYLAHQLMTLDLEFKQRYPAILSMYLTSFIDFVDLMRSKAASILDQQIQKQCDQMITIVRNSGLSSLSDLEVFPKSIEQGLRQCLRQLGLLQSVWQQVLPINVYCKVIAYLMNSFIEELILRVVSTKDIRADTATRLVTVFSIVTDKAPQIFPEPKEIHRHVKSWSKFSELVRVLGASLLEIGERWADGKGPLASEFTPDQVRQLVRALFQVSERRAAVLASII